MGRRLLLLCLAVLLGLPFSPALAQKRKVSFMGADKNGVGYELVGETISKLGVAVKLLPSFDKEVEVSQLSYLYDKSLGSLKKGDEIAIWFRGAESKLDLGKWRVITVSSVTDEDKQIRIELVKEINLESGKILKKLTLEKRKDGFLKDVSELE